jgi:hypothetical protein
MLEGNGSKTWDIEHDPFGYAERPDWSDFVLEVDSVLQLRQGPYILGVGFDGEAFVAMIVKNGQWDAPVERITCDRSALDDVVNRLAVDYVKA